MATGTSLRYKAFISYSHADAKSAEWLTRAIETYRLPKTLVGKPGLTGAIPARLSPLFRDKEELGAAHSLTNELKEALKASEYLIVVCSPAAANSFWVNEEIQAFIDIHGHQRVLPVIVSGSLERGGAGLLGALPPALFELSAGGPDYEPLAADLRPDGDGKEAVVLKMVAALAGVRLSELIQRDTKRRQQKIAIGSGVAAAIMLMLGIATWNAIEAEKLAEQRRGEAEDLIEFMITDLKRELESVGRLDALDAVATEALTYYENQPLGALPDDAVARRAEVMHMLGSVKQDQGHKDDAVRLFQTAFNATAELLRRAPGNGQRIFDHAQSAYYIGALSRAMGQFDVTEQRYKLYERLADQLITIDPTNSDWQMEVAYAANNLGALYHANLNRYEQAKIYFEKSLNIRLQLFPTPTESWQVRELGVAYGWLSSVYQITDTISKSIEMNKNELRLFLNWLEVNPEDYRIIRRIVVTYSSLGSRLLRAGQIDQALVNFLNGLGWSTALLDQDPENQEWLFQRAIILNNLAGGLMASNNFEEALTKIDEVKALGLSISDSSNPTSRTYRQTTLLPILTTAEIALQKEDYEEALNNLALLDFTNEEQRIIFRDEYIRYLDDRAIVAQRNGELDLALQNYQTILEILDKSSSTLDAFDQWRLAKAHAFLGNEDEATRLSRDLLQRGIAYPRFIQFCSNALNMLECQSTPTE